MPEIFYNGHIITMNFSNAEEELINEPEAVLITGGIIEAVGSIEQMLTLYPKAILRNLNGNCLMPGFIDCHGHITMNGKTSLCADVSECTSAEEIISVIKEYITAHKIKPNGAVAAYGYDHNFLAGKTHPTKDVLDKVSSIIPIYALHISGHVGCANSAALKLAGIDANTPDPHGGTIGRIENSAEPNGYLEETALLAVQNTVLKRVKKDIPYMMTHMQDVYIRNGITTVQDGATEKTDMLLLKMMNTAKLLKTDVVCYPVISMGGTEILHHNKKMDGKYCGRLKIGGYKLILDGSPQARTAWMSKPYEGEEEYCGFPWMQNGQVDSYVRVAVEERKQILVHCNGDAASEQFLNAYEKAVRESGCIENLRPVMIHCQTIRNDQLDRMAKLKMIASIFIGHVWYWGDVHLKNFGKERGNHISPVKDALTRGISVNFHQDTPITKPRVLHSVWCAVNRISREGKVIGEDQRISVYDALKAITINAAYEYFEEDSKGCLSPGKRADLVILDRSPLKVRPEDIADINIIETIKDGKTIYRQ